MEETLKGIYTLLFTLGYSETAVEQTWVKDRHTLVVVAHEKDISFYFLTDGYRYFQCTVVEAYYLRVPEMIKEWSK